jgi:hypothetical protein
MLVEQDISNTPNYPRAIRVAVIGFINYNMALACMWGPSAFCLAPWKRGWVSAASSAAWPPPP